MSEMKLCPFCGSTAVVKCRVDSDWGVDLKYRLLNDESNYDIKSMIADENYDSDERSGDYWGIEIFRCQSCRAEWGEGTDVCVAALNARIAELEALVDELVNIGDNLFDSLNPIAWKHEWLDKWWKLSSCRRGERE